MPLFYPVLRRVVKKKKKKKERTLFNITLLFNIIVPPSASHEMNPSASTATGKIEEQTDLRHFRSGWRKRWIKVVARWNFWPRDLGITAVSRNRSGDKGGLMIKFHAYISEEILKNNLKGCTISMVIYKMTALLIWLIAFKCNPSLLICFWLIKKIG